jgi:hypothetical protein
LTFTFTFFLAFLCILISSFFSVVCRFTDYTVFAIELIQLADLVVFESLALRIVEYPEEYFLKSLLHIKKLFTQFQNLLTCQSPVQL